MIDKQQTIKNFVELEGVGLHSGAEVKVVFKPAPEHHGIKFCRTDLPNQPCVAADARFVTDTARSTTLEQNGAKVQTVEHLLAAVVGLGIDNLLIEINAAEMPILDGSAIGFVTALESAEILTQDAEREYFVVEEEIRFYDAEKDAEILLLPASDYRLTVMVDYNSTVLGTQHATLSKIDHFKAEIANCRTFCFLHELEHLHKNNLIKGGDLSNAILLADRPVTQPELDSLAEILGKKKVTVNKQGVLSNTDLHHQNEPARHKLLDVIGDIALVGVRIKGQIIASKPGHFTNTAFAKQIQQHIKKQKAAKKIPKYDPSIPPVKDTMQVQEWLPHRHPFLMVDKIIELNENRIVGVKSIAFNEACFVGHFPNNPVYPGVLIIEGMAQTGGILALSHMDEPSNYWTYFLKIEEAKFKNKVVPGDTLIFMMELIEPIRRGLVQMRAAAYVGNTLVAEATLMAQLAKKS